MKTNSTIGVGHEVMATEIKNSIIANYHSGVTCMSFKYGDYTIFIEKDYGLWNMTIIKNFRGIADFDACLVDRIAVNYDFSAEKTKRWSSWVVDNAVDIICKNIIGYEKVADDDVAEMLLINDTIASYQAECDGYVADLNMVADSYDELDTKMAVFTAKSILKKIKKLSDDCLVSVGDITSCNMVWDDGWHLDLTAVAEWWCGRAENIGDYDLNHIINDLEDMLLTDYPMPLADDYTMLEVTDGDVFSMPINVPEYLAEDVKNFLSTYYHYAYCA